MTAEHDQQMGPEVLDEAGKPIDRSYFWTEGCAAFALQLAREIRSRGGQADIAVITNHDGEPWSDDHPFEFTHVVVSTADGYVDVNGFERDVETIANKIFTMHIGLEGDWDVDEFERSFVGSDDDKPLYGGDAEIAMWVRRLLDSDPARYGLDKPAARMRP